MKCWLDVRRTFIGTFFALCVCFYLCVGCGSIEELTMERAHTAVEGVFDTLRELSHARDHLKQLNSVYTASDGVHQVSCSLTHLNNVIGTRDPSPSSTHLHSILQNTLLFPSIEFLSTLLSTPISLCLFICSTIDKCSAHTYILYLHRSQAVILHFLLPSFIDTLVAMTLTSVPGRIEDFVFCSSFLSSQSCVRATVFWMNLSHHCVPAWRIFPM